MYQDVLTYRELHKQKLVRGYVDKAKTDEYERCKESVKKFLDTLSGIEKDICRRYFVDGESTTKIALELHYSETQIKRIRKRALDRVK